MQLIIKLKNWAGNNCKHRKKVKYDKTGRSCDEVD